MCSLLVRISASRNASSAPTRWARSTQYEGAKVLDEFGRQAIVPDEKPHVDGTVERVEEEVEICVFAQLPACNPFTEGAVGFAAPRPQEPLSEGFD